jgi:DNA-binding transcriptional regulator YdaS (Cro superfamily)
MTDSQLIDAAGGTKAVAALCAVSQSAVTQWRDKGIPPARRMYLALKVPKVFGKKRAEKAAA